jgi:hypothetical protein
MDLMSSSLGISDDLQLSRKLLASISAWKKLGGYAGDVIFSLGVMISFRNTFQKIRIVFYMNIPEF